MSAEISATTTGSCAISAIAANADVRQYEWSSLSGVLCDALHKVRPVDAGASVTATGGPVVPAGDGVAG
jgi:hypothetical protein